MQKRNKILLAAGAAALIAAGGLASLARADMEHRPGMACGMEGRGMDGGGMDGGGMGPGGRMMARRLMDRYDANKDGKLTQQELDQNRQQWFAEFDTDKDGKLSLEEFKLLWLKSNNERMVRAFQFLDRDGSGQVTVEEYKSPVERLVAMRDANGDGALDAADRVGGQGAGWRQGRGMGMRHGMGPGDGPPPCHGGGWGADGDGPGPGDQPPDDGAGSSE